MLRSRFAFALVLLAALSGTAFAEDEGRAKKEESSDEFSTSWIGLRAEIWYQPKLDLTARVGGLQGPIGQLIGNNTRFDAHEDLGVKNSMASPRDLGWRNGGPLALEAFVDTRWVSISALVITPFEYKGDAVLTRSISFGGFTFQASRRVQTTLAQGFGGIEAKINIFNNRFFRVSPLVALRLIGVDWTIEDTTPGPGFGKATTEDIDWPITIGPYKVFPYPEIGAEVRVGYRDFVELDLKISGIYVSYAGVTANTALIEAGITGYVPFVPNIGVRLGVRYYHLNAETNDESDEQFDVNMRITGATLSLIARF